MSNAKNNEGRGMKNEQLFLSEYKHQLKRQVEIFPHKYSWGIDHLDEVFQKMSEAFRRGSFNKDSDSIKLTCKKLGIKHTYQAMFEFINS